MLAGATITEEARAAAARLLEAPGALSASASGAAQRLSDHVEIHSAPAGLLRPELAESGTAASEVTIGESCRWVSFERPTHSAPFCPCGCGAMLHQRA